MTRPLNPVTPAFLEALQARLPTGTLRPPEPRHLSEPRGIWTGQAGIIATPATAQEVAAIIRAANEASVAVVPYGGGTGLVGGQVAPDIPPPIVLSAERLTAIREVTPAENAVTAEAGVVLADLRARVAKAQRLFPLMIASEGSCRIGGNLATNAGGMNVLRYGNTRDLVLGIEAVLPDGTIFNGLKSLRKDNTGYDLKNLLVGSEGTLGFITAASLRLFARPSRRQVALLAVPSPAHALDLLHLAQHVAGEAVSIFELLGQMSFEFISETMPDVSLPMVPAPHWAVLMELGTAEGVDGDALLQHIWEKGTAAGLLDDAILAQSEAQADALIAMREAVPEANKRIGSISSHDVSLPLSQIAPFIAEAPKALAQIGDFRINCFGHLGDGNLHYNVYPPKSVAKAPLVHLRDEIAALVHKMVVARGGSFSAEHGVGRLKVGELERFGDPAKLAMMRSIKQALDPKGIMNPGAVLAHGS